MSGICLLNHRVKIITWLIFFINLSIHQLQAQNYFFDIYGIPQGLASHKIYTILQDSKNYIWLGTESGVSRFDGKKFINFTSVDSLASGGVKCMVEDSLGYIWFGHINGGISRYNGRTFEQAAFDSVEITWDITSITRIKDKLWFTGAANGAIRADLPVKDIRHIRSKQFMGKDGLSDQVFGSSVTADGAFICVTDAGLKRYNNVLDVFEKFRMPHMTTFFLTTYLYEDRAGNLWFGTHNGGIYKFIMSENKMVYFDLMKEGLASNFVSCIIEDSHGRVWVGTMGGGIALFDGDNIRKLNNTNGLNAVNIQDIIEDVEGNILIADREKGLAIFKGDAFVTINDKELLPDLNVNSILQDNSGALWFATNSGILKYFAVSDSRNQIYHKGNNLKEANIKFLKKDNDDNIWLGSNSGGIIRYNKKESVFEPNDALNNILFEDIALKQVTALEIDRHNNLWIGTNREVTELNLNNHGSLSHGSMDSSFVSKITSLYCDPEGNMWIGAESIGRTAGLIRYDVSENKFSRISALSGIIPRTMVMDKDKVLWIGTDERLIAFKNDSVFQTLTTDDGLLSNHINLLATDNDGTLFIGTDKGLNRYFPKSKRIFSYTERNGFPGIATNHNAVYHTSAGDLWFGTANGATRLTPGNLSAKEPEPLTHITELRIKGKYRNMVPGMKLNFSERTISFDYISICLNNPDIVKYKIKLNKFDTNEDWQSVDDQTSKSYDFLSSGKYTFNVISCNSQGVWNKNPVSFSFTIKPPFYLTWWFILIVVAIIIVLIVIYIKIRERNLVRENLILEEKVEERTAEVVQKSIEIEEKNRDITASIRYAERIQRSMLPKEDFLPETFVLFMPKDIVSGDFYWMYENDESQFLAVCDCTGHGVPGAFMSIIGHNSLNKIIKESGITKPSSVLNNLNSEVLKALAQRKEEIINDGMDMAFIAFNRKKFILEFAGAYNPIYIVRKGEVLVYRGDRFPIGMTAVGDKKSFTNQVVEVQPGDMVYMFTDGYADQFGEADGKKFRTGNVKKLLSEICDLSICEQHARLKREIVEWKGKLYQVDDILFVGTRIPGN